MKKIILLIYLTVFYISQVYDVESSFFAKENNKVLKSEGDSNIKHTPGCDLSIVLSIMGFDSSILKNENIPVWHYKESYETYLSFWQKPHNPKTWILDSCVWYSGNIVEKLGYEKIKEYIHKFKFGNQDITVMNRKDWPGALVISAVEQVEFLQRLVDRKLLVIAHAYNRPRNYYSYKIILTAGSFMEKPDLVKDQEKKELDGLLVGLQKIKGIFPLQVGL